ncbi:alpha/beta fold hydrolase [Kocuria sp. HSID17590]|uniref:alpha/beta fold hydrolase n=2 Tax=unclassified Kocuria TaxID=2649579 RepID=UPI000F8834B6|nr:alpha/beta hydrolase [Kocuria sp. HSID17590]RUP80937.1 alpha/beta hydrolase [Kocuria sp. HSID17590]
MSRSTFATHTARVNDTQLAYTDEGQGRAVVLLHGHGYDRSMWDAQIPVLVDQGWRVVTPDLRGFGESEVTPGIVYTEEFAADVIALLDHLGLDSVVLVGFSMAGQVALQIVATHPERVAALIVNDTVPHAEDVAGRRRRHVGADGILTGGMPAYADRVLASMIHEDNVERLPEVARAVREMIAACPAEGAAAAMRGRAERQDFTETLRAWRKPALVVVGDGDAFDGGAARRMAELLPHGELAVVPRSGHTPNMENPADYDAALLRFLGSLT